LLSRLYEDVTRARPDARLSHARQALAGRRCDDSRQRNSLLNTPNSTAAAAV
jgi:hypothetical protein